MITKRERGVMVDFYSIKEKIRSITPEKFKDLWTRCLSSMVLLVLGCFIFWGSRGVASIILFAMCGISFWEYGRLWHLVPKQKKKFKFAFFSYIFIGTWSVFFLRFMMDDYMVWVGGAVLVTVASDVMAYFSGRLLGGKRLFPEISPGKTVSGYAGGLLAGTVIGSLWFVFGVTKFEIIILSFIMSLMGQAGDLLESYLKRLANVKDSSSLLPGHGGILDRFDAFFAVIIVVFLYVIFFDEQGYERLISLF